MDTLSIGKDKIMVKLLEIDQTQLNFDPENPRVYSVINVEKSIPSQSEIEELMKKREHVRKLAEDIKINGGLIEPIIVKDGDNVVIEGNSRLAAYRILAEKDPIQWARIKCKVLPADIREDLVFNLVGQYHLNGKTPWDAFEQAGYLYRRVKKTKKKIEIIAEEVNIEKSKAKNMVRAYELMIENEEKDTHKFSYYFEFVKDSSLRECCEIVDGFETVILEQIKNNKIERAEDVRKLGKVVKQKDKQSKKLIRDFTDRKIDLYDAYEAIESAGKTDSSVKKLETFRKYINDDSFEKSVRSSKEKYKLSRYELEVISRRINNLLKKWDKLDE